MEKELIKTILEATSGFLNTEQSKQLNKLLLRELEKYDITLKEADDTKRIRQNNELLQAFISAKKIE